MLKTYMRHFLISCLFLSVSVLLTLISWFFIESSGFFLFCLCLILLALISFFGTLTEVLTKRRFHPLLTLLWSLIFFAVLLLVIALLEMDFWAAVIFRYFMPLLFICFLLLLSVYLAVLKRQNRK